MAIPDFQSLMLPLLLLTADKAEHTLAGCVATLADQFALTNEEREQVNAAGRSRTFYNRVAWASTYLRAGVLMESTGRGRFRITSRGVAVAAAPPKRIDIPYLMQFEEFQVLRSGGQGKTAAPLSAVEAAPTATPEELLESSFQSIRASVEAELLTRVKAADPAFFEGLVVELLVAMGYGGSQEDAGRAIGKSGDGGIDGVIKEDRLGLDTIYLQAKRWEGSVGRPAVQGFVGSLAGQHSRRGVMITTSDFTADARSYVKGIDQQVILVNGSELARLMFEFGVGVTPHGSPYILKRVDPDFFGEM